MLERRENVRHRFLVYLDTVGGKFGSFPVNIFDLKIVSFARNSEKTANLRQKPNQSSSALSIAMSRSAWDVAEPNVDGPALRVTKTGNACRVRIYFDVDHKFVVSNSILYSR